MPGGTPSASTRWADTKRLSASLATELEGCANVHLDATEHGDKLIFLHTVKAGPANQSYGLQVAALAGVPPKVIGAAKKYLHELERRSAATHAPRPQQELLLEFPREPEIHPVVESLNGIDPDSLTPKAALDALYELKNKWGQIRFNEFKIECIENGYLGSVI